MVFNWTILNNDLCNSAISQGLQIYNKCSLSFNTFTPLSYLINFPLKLLTCYPKPKRQNLYPISDQKSKFNTLFLIRNAWTWHPQLIPNVCDLICSQLHILSGEMAEFCTHCIKIIHLLSDLLYNPGQNYVGHSCRMHCLDHRSFFTWKQTFLVGQILPSPPPPCNVVQKERLADIPPNIARRREGRERIL